MIYIFCLCSTILLHFHLWTQMVNQHWTMGIQVIHSEKSWSQSLVVTIPKGSFNGNWMVMYVLICQTISIIEYIYMFVYHGSKKNVLLLKVGDFFLSEKRNLETSEPYITTNLKPLSNHWPTSREKEGSPSKKRAKRNDFDEEEQVQMIKVCYFWSVGSWVTLRFCILIEHGTCRSKDEGISANRKAG